MPALTLLLPGRVVSLVLLGRTLPALVHQVASPALLAHTLPVLAHQMAIHALLAQPPPALGHRQSGSSSCASCDAGTYYPTAGSSCGSCAVGTYSSALAHQGARPALLARC
ncbi:unnamed protein product [Polarella glacialis]|uniref:Uncharacterized protein n=1 Tax=Polarella glacialis TaxID=89957 RepID=A0A813DXE8_POLGL|nr:unnamed protein product [Polarella glacialis]